MNVNSDFFWNVLTIWFFFLVITVILYFCLEVPVCVPLNISYGFSSTVSIVSILHFKPGESESAKDKVNKSEKDMQARKHI